MKKLFAMSLLALLILASCNWGGRPHFKSKFGTVENVFMTDRSGTVSLKGDPTIYQVFGDGINDKIQELHNVFHMIKPGDQVALTYDTLKRVYGVINYSTNRSVGQNVNEIK